MIYDTKSPELFADSLNQYINRRNIDVLIPVGDQCCFYASLVKDRIKAAVPVADYETMLIARDKVKMTERARELGFNVPEVIHSPNRFPVVLKGVTGRGLLRFVNDEMELADARSFFTSRGVPYFITEYIDGTQNFSYAALVQDGRVRAFFTYKEIREYPLTGGAASFALSAYDGELATRCQRLLEDLKWNGVAMVEFKINAQGKLYFMEVNPKFWASLELAIASGVNFPLLLLKMIEGELIVQPKYLVGIRFRWLFEDLLSFFSAPNRSFIGSFLGRSVVDVHLDDLPAHILRPIIEYESSTRGDRKGFKLGYPYGIPVIRRV
jgi:predicted ATP-grasp superfamily ATP-dependent carboligase